MKPISARIPQTLLLILLACAAVSASCSWNRETPLPTKSPTPTFLPTVIATVERTVWIGSQMVPCPGQSSRQCYVYKEQAQDNWTIFPGIFQAYDFWPGSEVQAVVREDQVSNPPPGGSDILWTLVKGLTSQPPSASVALAADRFTANAASGETVVYNLAVTNLGETAASYTLAASGSWLPVLSTSQTGELAPGQSFVFTLQVPVSAVAENGSTDTAQLVIQSLQAPGVSLTQPLITTCN